MAKICSTNGVDLAGQKKSFGHPKVGKKRHYNFRHESRDPNFSHFRVNKHINFRLFELPDLQ